MREEGTPGTEFCFTGALDEDVKVFWERGEEGKDSREEGTFGVWGWFVDFVVEDGVEEDFERVGEVGEGLVAVGEGGGGGFVEVREVAAEEGGEDKLSTDGEAEKGELDVTALDEIGVDT